MHAFGKNSELNGAAFAGQRAGGGVIEPNRAHIAGNLAGHYPTMACLANEHRRRMLGAIEDASRSYPAASDEPIATYSTAAVNKTVVETGLPGFVEVLREPAVPRPVVMIDVHQSRLSGYWQSSNHTTDGGRLL